MSADQHFGCRSACAVRKSRRPTKEDNCGAVCSECTSDLAVAYRRLIETAGIKACKWNMHCLALVTAPLRYEQVDDLRGAALCQPVDPNLWHQRIVKRALACLCSSPKQPGAWLCDACHAACPKHLCTLGRHRRENEATLNRLCSLMLDFAERRSDEK